MFSKSGITLEVLLEMDDKGWKELDMDRKSRMKLKSEIKKMKGFN